MAQVVQNNSNNWLSTLGGIASLAGTFVPGMQWLTPLGMGISAIGSGKTPDVGALAQSISAMKEAGAFDKLSAEATNTAKNALTANQLTDEQIAIQNWEPFFKYGSTGGYRYSW